MVDFLGQFYSHKLLMSNNNYLLINVLSVSCVVLGYKVEKGVAVAVVVLIDIFGFPESDELFVC